MWNNAAPISEKNTRGAQHRRADKRKERCRPAKILRGGNSFGRTAAFHGFCAPAFVRRARPVSESASPRFGGASSFIPTAFPYIGAAVFPLAGGPFVWATLFPLSGGACLPLRCPSVFAGFGTGKSASSRQSEEKREPFKNQDKSAGKRQGGKREGRGKTKNRDLRTKGWRRRGKKKRQKGERKKAVQGRGKEKAREKRGRGEIEGAPKAG